MVGGYGPGVTHPFGTFRDMSKATEDLNREADDAWDSISKSPFRFTYQRELYLLAGDIVVQVDEAEALIVPPPPKPGSGKLTVKREITERLIRALGAGTRLRSLCFATQHPGYKQTPLEHKVQQRRAAWVQDILQRIDLTPLKDTQVRNTLEHFDEYVDHIALQARSGPFPALVASDMALSDRHLLSAFNHQGVTFPNVHHIRTYVADEHRFINCGHEVDMAALRNTAAQIRDRVKPLLGQPLNEDGSAMHVLTDKSF
jgi:hypothetical protein